MKIEAAEITIKYRVVLSHEELLMLQKIVGGLSSIATEETAKLFPDVETVKVEDFVDDLAKVISRSQQEVESISDDLLKRDRAEEKE